MVFTSTKTQNEILTTSMCNKPIGTFFMEWYQYDMYNIVFNGTDQKTRRDKDNYGRMKSCMTLLKKFVPDGTHLRAHPGPNQDDSQWVADFTRIIPTLELNVLTFLNSKEVKPLWSKSTDSRQRGLRPCYPTTYKKLTRANTLGITFPNPRITES